MTGSSSSSQPSKKATEKNKVVPAAVTKERLLRLTNLERKKKGLASLQRDPRLEAAAQAQADDMRRRRYLNHTSPEGIDPLQRIRSAGYREPSCNCAWQFFYGENIAWGNVSPDVIIQKWLLSPEHRKHLLSPDYRDVGIGYTGSYWVETFGGMAIGKVHNDQ